MPGDQILEGQLLYRKESVCRKACNDVTRRHQKQHMVFFSMEHRWNPEENTVKKNCPFQPLMLPSEPHCSGMPMNSVSEPAVKVSRYLQETVWPVTSLSAVGWKGSGNCLLYICIIFLVFFYYYLRKDQRCLLCIFPEVWALSHDHDCTKS